MMFELTDALIRSQVTNALQIQPDVYAQTWQTEPHAVAPRRNEMLPKDYARCSGDGCPQRSGCARYMTREGAWLPRFAVPPYLMSKPGECREFTPYDPGDKSWKTCGQVVESEAGALLRDERSRW